MVQKVDQLIHAKWLAPIEPVNTVLEQHSIAIDQGKIIAVLPTDKAKIAYEATTIHTLNDHIVLPGFVNAHTHSPMSFLRGYADDLALMDWLENYMWPAENRFCNEDGILAASNLAMADMICNGITCFNDMFTFPTQIEQAAIEQGLRAMLSLYVMSVPTNWVKTEEGYFHKIEQTYQQRSQHPRIHWAISPHAPYTVSDQAFIKAKELAEQWKLLFAVHLHETEQEINDSIKQYGMRPIERLEKLGIFSSNFLAIHMVHLSDDEIALARQHQLSIAHCPESNLKLGSGIAPISQLIDAGVNVAIGTDGVASNNDLDMLAETRTAAFLAKGVAQNPTIIPAEQALEMATLNAAKALGLDAQIGSLLPGKQADIIAVNLDHPSTQPVYHPIAALVYTASRLQISDVWVAGEQLLNKGQFNKLDYEKIVAESQPWIDTLKSNVK